jgi:hypothetical protein
MRSRMPDETPAEETPAEERVATHVDVRAADGVSARRISG